MCSPDRREHHQCTEQVPREVCSWSHTPLGRSEPAKTMRMHPSPTGPAAVPLAPWKRNWSARSDDHVRAARAVQARLLKSDNRCPAPAAGRWLVVLSRTTTHSINSVLAIKAVKGQDQRRKKDRHEEQLFSNKEDVATIATHGDPELKVQRGNIWCRSKRARSKRSHPTPEDGAAAGDRTSLTSTFSSSGSNTARSISLTSRRPARPCRTVVRPWKHARFAASKNKGQPLIS